MQLTGAQIVCECLLREGVQVMFGLPGGAIMPFYQTLPEYPGLKHILVRHEQNAGHAADGYARASGKVGVLMTGSYIVNLLTSTYPDVNFAVAPIPGPTGGQSSFAGGDTLAMIKGIAPEKKAVIEDFVKFYMEPEQQVFITQEAGMPSRTDLAEEAYANFDPRNLIAYDILSKARTPYTYASDELFVSRTGPFLNLIQSAVFGDDVDGAIETAQEDFTKILDRTNP